MSRHSNPILPLTRIVSIVITAILLSAFIILYLFPGRTEQLFALTIRPDLTPMVMGAGYLAGAYFFIRTITGQRWHEVANGFIATTAFSIPMALATLLHLDRFNHSHITFWLWLATYLAVPVLVPYVYWRNGGNAPNPGNSYGVQLPPFVRLLMGLAGAGELLLGIAMFLFPNWAMSVWPWALTPLTARIIAGWLVLPGVGALLIALDPRWSTARIMLEGDLLWVALLLLAVWRGWGDLVPKTWITWLYVGALGVALTAVLALYFWMEARQTASKIMPLRSSKGV